MSETGVAVGFNFNGWFRNRWTLSTLASSFAIDTMVTMTPGFDK
jgi:hypothetical protein